MGLLPPRLPKVDPLDAAGAVPNNDKPDAADVVDVAPNSEGAVCDVVVVIWPRLPKILELEGLGGLFRLPKMLDILGYRMGCQRRKECAEAAVGVLELATALLAA